MRGGMRVFLSAGMRGDATRPVMRDPADRATYSPPPCGEGLGVGVVKSGRDGGVVNRAAATARPLRSAITLRHHPLPLTLPRKGEGSRCSPVRSAADLFGEPDHETLRVGS